MLDEGAGKRGAIDLSKAIDDLGARIDTEANADASFVSLAVLKRNLADALAIYGDVITRPRLEAAEFKRVKELWHNELLQRARSPTPRRASSTAWRSSGRTTLTGTRGTGRPRAPRPWGWKT